MSLDPSDTIESILSGFGEDVEVEPAIDVLIKTYAEKGADRATDLLLEGAFSTFFNITQDGSSYAGALQESLREVAREDLAIRKTNRRPNRSRLVAQTESPDFEYNSDSVTETVRVDPPTGNLIG